MNKKKGVFTCLLAISLLVTEVPMLADAKAYTESNVTADMCTSDYWINLMGEAANNVLMSKEAIGRYNQSALTAADCNMNDIENMDSSYDATALKAALAADVMDQMPKKDTYVNSVLTDAGAYYGAVSACVQATGWEGTLTPKYALAVEQTQIKAIPTVDYIGYSETDSDDEIIVSSLRVNEPFVIKQWAVVGNDAFYYGYSNHVTGWVLADDLAICDTKKEWTDMWKVDMNSTNFLVVTSDEFCLSESHYAPATSGLKLTMGTVLKQVPENDVPRNIAMRGTWNNYVVYVPTRDTTGRMVRQITLVSQSKDVNEGYLPLTSANIMEIAFTSLGNTYGWGGMLDSVDCSAYVRNIYKCFGFEMPRNTSWQRKVPGTAVDITGMDDATKTAVLSTCIPGTPLYLPGHTMIYLGTVDGKCYVISAMGSASESVGSLDVKVENAVAVTSLNVRRRNGNSWLASIDCVVLPWNIQ